MYYVGMKNENQHTIRILSVAGAVKIGAFDAPATTEFRDGDYYIDAYMFDGSINERVGEVYPLSDLDRLLPKLAAFPESAQAVNAWKRFNPGAATVFRLRDGELKSVSYVE